jgi:hypothetical protein
MNKSITKAGATLAILAILGGCTTMGTGSGAMSAKGKPTEPVLFKWKSNDGGISGSMVATLPDATYTGRFFQITQQTQRQTLAPMWDGWSEGWDDWPYWGPWPANSDIAQFITRYSGKVVATLQSTGGRRMRCRFHLAHPVGGMSGGGQGECQLSGGRVINAAFDRN